MGWEMGRTGQHDRFAVVLPGKKQQGSAPHPAGHPLPWARRPAASPFSLADPFIAYQTRCLALTHCSWPQTPSVGTSHTRHGAWPQTPLVWLTACSTRHNPGSYHHFFRPFSPTDAARTSNRRMISSASLAPTSPNNASIQRSCAAA